MKSFRNAYKKTSLGHYLARKKNFSSLQGVMQILSFSNTEPVSAYRPALAQKRAEFLHSAEFLVFLLTCSNKRGFSSRFIPFSI